MTIMNDNDALWHTALGWLMRQHDSDLDEAEREALHAWLAASAENRAAYREAERLWTLTGLIPPADERH
ncbi:FecR/PupR family sigma factor regulator [Chromohalobacter nigrandesensis]|uniref:FecR/PupR family sigma factor regulator n=1 Tax=Chromohalobacter nigrandesensis TaxID=119863 RepID=UPI001FF548E2|nr:DUF4880 domain-containing protein [Chromohalobacter nigrandesensis]MCK0745719.1 DUF4880 domain-containing protein [Chromohalobacter nigrandesensis]